MVTVHRTHASPSNFRYPKIRQKKRIEHFFTFIYLTYISPNTLPESLFFYQNSLKNLKFKYFYHFYYHTSRKQSFIRTTRIREEPHPQKLFFIFPWTHLKNNL